MRTQEALTKFLNKCEERGLSDNTRRTYHGYLRYFVVQYPELPTDTKTIEAFLKDRKETPGHRGTMFKKLQAFYAYLEQFEGIESPIPPRGTIGRPRKVKPANNPGPTAAAPRLPLPEEKAAPASRRSSAVPTAVSTALSISTADAVKAFVKSRQVQGVSERTMQGYPSYFNPFITMFPELPLTAEEIEEFLDSLGKADKKGKARTKVDMDTRWSYNKTLKALYHFLEQRKKIPKDLFTFPQVKVSRK